MAVAVTRPSGVRRQRRDRPSALLAVELIIGLAAVPCGILLMVNGLGMPRDVLQDSPFASFLVPGFLLSFVVGGSLLSAAWTVWRRWPAAPLVSLAAGCILLGWIVVESVMVSDGRGLQAGVFALALLTIGLAWRLRRVGAEEGGAEMDRLFGQTKEIVR